MGLASFNRMRRLQKIKNIETKEANIVEEKKVVEEKPIKEPEKEVVPEVKKETAKRGSKRK